MSCCDPNDICQVCWYFELPVGIGSPTDDFGLACQYKRILQSGGYCDDGAYIGGNIELSIPIGTPGEHSAVIAERKCVVRPGTYRNNVFGFGRDRVQSHPFAPLHDGAIGKQCH